MCEPGEQVKSVPVLTRWDSERLLISTGFRWWSPHTGVSGQVRWCAEWPATATHHEQTPFLPQFWAWFWLYMLQHKGGNEELPTSLFFHQELYSGTKGRHLPSIQSITYHDFEETLQSSRQSKTETVNESSRNFMPPKPVSSGATRPSYHPSNDTPDCALKSVVVKCDPQIKNSSWKFVRNANSWAPPETQWIRKSSGGASNLSRNQLCWSLGAAAI